MYNLEMLSWHVLLYMLFYIMSSHLMPYICPVAYSFIAMNMHICCFSFLLTSWCQVVSFLLVNLCLFLRCSNYLFWNIMWVLCTQANFDNFRFHMTSVPSLQTCYGDVAVSHLLKLLQYSNLSWWFSLIH